MKLARNGQRAWTPELENQLFDVWNRAHLRVSEVSHRVARSMASVSTKATEMRGQGVTMLIKVIVPPEPPAPWPDTARYEDDPIAVAEWAASTPKFYPLPWNTNPYSSTSGLIGGGRLR
jgi:hypothetical protein